MRSALIVIGVLSLVLASCATIPTPQEANDAVLVLSGSCWLSVDGAESCPHQGDRP